METIQEPEELTSMRFERISYIEIIMHVLRLIDMGIDPAVYLSGFLFDDFGGKPRKERMG